MIGYVFIAFMLAVVSLYFAYQNLNFASPRFELVLQNVQFIFLVFVPILTMRVLAEERKQKTDQLLLTLPMTVSDIVAGKYLGVVVFVFHSHGDHLFIPADSYHVWYGESSGGIFFHPGILPPWMRQYCHRSILFIHYGKSCDLCRYDIWHITGILPDGYDRQNGGRIRPARRGPLLR